MLVDDFKKKQMKKRREESRKRRQFGCNKCRKLFDSAYALHHHKCNPIRMA